MNKKVRTRILEQLQYFCKCLKMIFSKIYLKYYVSEI